MDAAAVWAQPGGMATAALTNRDGPLAEVGVAGAALGLAAIAPVVRGRLRSQAGVPDDIFNWRRTHREVPRSGL